MTIRFVDGEYVGIVCNICQTPAPSREEITAKHGLSRCGWRVDGGIHLCPDHVEEQVPPSSPIYDFTTDPNK